MINKLFIFISNLLLFLYNYFYELMVDVFYFFIDDIIHNIINTNILYHITFINNRYMYSICFSSKQIQYKRLLFIIIVLIVLMVLREFYFEGDKKLGTIWNVQKTSIC